MSWRDRTAEILENAAGVELTKPTKAPGTPLLSVLSVPPQALSGEHGARGDRHERRMRRAFGIAKGPVRPDAPTGSKNRPVDDPDAIGSTLEAAGEGQDEAMDERRAYVLGMLAGDPQLDRAVNVFSDDDPAIIAIARRGRWYAELTVEHSKFDPLKFLDLAGSKLP